jgi:solute carrier family 25 protein 38
MAPPAPLSQEATTAIELAAKRFLSGASSGTLIAALLQPLDVIKTTMQSSRLRAPLAPPPSALSVAAGLRARGGTLALWAGLSPTVIRVFFGAGIYFSGLHALVDALGPAGGALGAFGAGVGARFLAALALSPVSVVKTRMEDGMAGGPLAGLGTWRALRLVARTEGAASLYSGLLPTLVRDAPYSGIYFAAFSALKGAWRAGPGAGAAPPLDAAGTFCAGLAAGALATAVTHPADVIKTRLQLQPAGGRFVDGAVLANEVRALVRAEGVGGLFAGLLPRVAKRATTTALTWTLFEVLLKRMGVEVGGGGGGG